MVSPAPGRSGVGWKFALRAFLALVFVVVSSTVLSQGLPEIVTRRGVIRVLIARDATKLPIIPNGPHQVYSGSETIGRSSISGDYRCSAGSTGVTLKTNIQRIGPAPELRIVSASISGGKSGFTLGNEAYLGNLILQAEGGAVVAVNEVLIEDWLVGVLAAEIGEGPPEQLKAQAITARSEAIVKLQRGKHANEGYDLCNEVHCMVYHGTRKQTPAMRAAVEATFGTVLTTDGGEVLDAVFHNVCGGITASIDEVWGGRPNSSLVPVQDSPRTAVLQDLDQDARISRFILSERGDAYCNPANPGYPNYARKYFSWEKQVSGEEISKKAGVGVVMNVQVSRRGPSGRVQKMLITGRSGAREVGKPSEIRDFFGLWSAQFVIQVDRAQGGLRSITFRGAGNGHGVGMCQQGARIMALRGRDAQEILGHYYPGAELRKVYRP